MKGAKGVIISITGGEDMRLMEVDEAASHIKELVDPDANIIWGSAFNNDLGGKIRVSVVATGIEADAVQAPQPGKVFTFPTARTTPPAPAKPAAAEEPTTDEDENDILDLSPDDDDELLLDAEDILTSPVSSAPIAPPTDDEYPRRQRHRQRNRPPIDTAERHLVRADVQYRAGARPRLRRDEEEAPSCSAIRSTSRASSTGRTTSRADLWGKSPSCRRGCTARR